MAARIVSNIEIAPKQFRESILSLPTTEDYILLDDWQLSSQNIEWMIGWGKLDTYIYAPYDTQPISTFDKWLKKHSDDWRLGYINYDFKNALHPNIEQKEKDSPTSDWIHFFVPEVIYIAKNRKVEAHHYPETQLPNFKINQCQQRTSSLNFKPNTHSKEYIQNVHSLQDSILAGGLHEINYCIEWEANEKLSLPASDYYHLQAILQAPFSCYFKMDDVHLLCNSPERFIRKTGNTIITQPIKGTSPRFEDAKMDEASKNRLKEEKDRTENIMVVDLVRSDFARIAQLGTVKVSELATVYTFPQVHQLISTIECTLKDGVNFSDILEASFPMGSMSGAPRINAMNNAENIESMKRDIYSGTVGYFTPNGDFDFNVVIRSLIYFEAKQKSYIRTGSAITVDSVAEDEWEECLLKGEKIIQLFKP